MRILLTSTSRNLFVQSLMTSLLINPRANPQSLLLFELPATFEIIDTYFLFLEALPLLDFQDIGSPDYLHYTSPFF